jgi:hypothetical protein
MFASHVLLARYLGLTLATGLTNPGWMQLANEHFVGSVLLCFIVCGTTEPRK